MDFMKSVAIFFKEGGFFLWPLTIIFVVGVAIAIERWFYLTKETIKNRSLWDEVAPHLGAGNFKQAITLANNSTAQIGTVLKYGLARLATARRRDDIQQAMEESLLEIVPRLEKRTHYLSSSLANIGMLVGLLGHHPRADPRVRRRVAGQPGREGVAAGRSHFRSHEQHGRWSRAWRSRCCWRTCSWSRRPLRSSTASRSRWSSS